MKSKSTFTVVLFYSMVGLLMISIHQNMTNGFAASYVFYMLTFMFFLGFTYRKMNESKEDNNLKDKGDSKPEKHFKQKHK
ncbi:hypothetical protein [Cytophaga hutchinsonii]|jgi:hypothetical protein|uniref:Uncharacterized protein n=1 Tax=Cytophaga hutchinsonii (strain ATCC 33406 / DSM 1761 / CIP 103989 / NBRC 15051 / NCIMB 9469 / D465) TaxID=269798 RepID=A0A6N4SVH3_CYTH3|nr:hypothetical protein [Cytophaga hutchinsonii]ABG60508.1 hypothetical protein CHU_3269 [Cytophaga hutchinsonii ATCC 33406]SFX84476.1 hypothetical protein SAMN04487930_11113 [Cytophaga hutchinsonii ATCC 33406]